MDAKVRKRVLFSRKSRPERKPEKILEKTQEIKPVIKTKRKKWLVAMGLVVAILAGMYCTAVFSNIPFIKKWRDIYIDTAMDTFTHKWLATYFIPGYIIQDVMDAKVALIQSQQTLATVWEPSPEPSPSPSVAPSSSALPSPSPSPSISPEELAKQNFIKKFPELNLATFEEYVSKKPELLDNGYAKLLINEAGLRKKGTTIMTKNGDQIVALDAENNLIIAKVTGDGFQGKLAIVKNPAQVRLVVSKYLGSIGQVVDELASQNKAVLAINASGFADPEWEGNGGQVVGLTIASGKQYKPFLNNDYLNIGFAYDNRLYIGLSTKQITYRDAVQFIPALIINGKNVTDGETGFGIQPRTVIGQAADGTVFLLTIDGRQVGYSLGATVGDCAAILSKYGAVQAANMDGGSSTIMIYRDEIITKTSGLTSNGRYVPDAWIVDYANNIQTKPAP